MSHADWRRYYAIAYDRPFPEPVIFKHRERCLEHMAYMMFEHVKTFGASPKPLAMLHERWDEVLDLFSKPVLQPGIDFWSDGEF